MTDRLLTDAERDRLLLAVARFTVARHSFTQGEGIGYAAMRLNEAFHELRGALQSIEVENK